MFLGDHGFNILIHKYFSEELERLISLVLKAREQGNLGAIYFP